VQTKHVSIGKGRGIYVRFFCVFLAFLNEFWNKGETDFSETHKKGGLGQGQAAGQTVESGGK